MAKIKLDDIFTLQVGDGDVIPVDHAGDDSDNYQSVLGMVKSSPISGDSALHAQNYQNYFSDYKLGELDQITIVVGDSVKTVTINAGILSRIALQYLLLPERESMVVWSGSRGGNKGKPKQRTKAPKLAVK